MQDRDKAIIALKLTPGEFDELRTAVKNERERTQDAARNGTDLSPGERQNERIRLSVLDGLLAKVS